MTLRHAQGERSTANPHRGEAILMVDGTPRLLRPSFTALVAAEEELGPLFALVERAGNGQLRIAEMAALFWHCLADRDLADQTAISRDQLGEAVMQHGIAACAKPLRIMLGQILQGAG